MVMSALRDRIKIIIFITLVAFVGLIFFDWGMQKSRGGGGGNPAVLGRVNGRDISDQAYRRAYQSILSNFEARTGRSVEASDYDAIEKETWVTIVQELVLQDQIEKYGIHVTDAEILELLQTNPPDFVRGNFIDAEGQFDQLQYRQALTQAGSDPGLKNFWSQVEALIRATAPADKMRNLVGLAARVTSAEVMQRFLDRNEKVRVRYAASTTAAVELDPSSIPDSDVLAWYDSHLDDFRVEEQAILDVVRVSKAASAEDSAEVRRDLLDVRQAILDGADFGEQAADVSDDGTAEGGGDLGFFSRGDMVPAFEEAAFALDPGAVSEVVESPFGYHLIKVEERRTENGEEQIRARHILLRVEASNRAIRMAADRMDDFLLEIEDGASFEQAAEAVELEVETTPPFERSGFIAGFGMLRSAQRFAFSSEPGTITQRTTEDAGYIYAFRLREVLEPRTLPFDEVRDRAAFALGEERRREGAREAMTAALTGGDGSLESVAAALGTEVDSTGEFTRESFVPGVGRRNGFVAAAFTLAAGERSGLVESDRGFYVLELVERIPADDAQFAEQRDQIRGELLMDKRQSILVGWLEQLLMDAKVEDFRGGAPTQWKPEPSDLIYLAGA